MAHLHKKMKKGRAYYYVRETKRIGGKPTVVNQVYLGTAEKILSVFMGKKQLPKRFSSKEFGSLFILHELEREIGLAEMVDQVAPRRRRSEGPSCGQLLLYAVINRAIAPRSKRQLARWYERTDIQNIRPVRLKALSAQNFWNHWDRIGEEHLEEIAEGFFRKLQGLLPGQEEQYLFDTTNYYTYLDSMTPSELAKRGRNKASKHHLRQVGLALITERASGIPIYYRSYAGNQHDARFFQLHLDEILEKLTTMGVGPQALTLIFDKGMNSEEAIGRIDAQCRLHFITSYSPYFVPELARIPLKKFQVLPCEANQKRVEKDRPEDQILYYETEAAFWGRQRKVLITFNPKTFRKKRYDLREKLQRLRQELYEMRRKHREGAPQWKEPSAVNAHYVQRCGALHLKPEFFQLSFYRQGGRSAMAFQLNRYQVESQLRRFAKTILITDHRHWTPEEIYQAYMDRHIIEDQFRRSKNPFQVALMPQYHWTDSKIRIHVFVCIVALSYLTLLQQRLKKAAMSISIREAMEELRSLRTAIYWMPNERKPRRLLEEPNPTQLAILQALGFQVKDGRVLQR